LLGDSAVRHFLCFPTRRSSDLSLFPGTEGLQQALAPDNPQRCAAIRPLDVPHARMTLTYAALASARHQVLYIAGEDKLATLEDRSEEHTSELQSRENVVCGRLL